MLFSGAASVGRTSITGKYCDAGDDCREREQCCCRRRPAHSPSVLLQGLELFWQLRIAHLIRVKIHDGDPHSMLHFAGAKLVQKRSPLVVFFQIFGHMFGEQDVPGVTAIHHPLRHVQTGSG